MGNSCRKKVKTKDDHDLTPTITPVVYEDDSSSSPVKRWEEKQRENNDKIMIKMREDFKNRPDTFLLNLLVVSMQFYRNYNKERADISNHIRDREQGLSKKLSPSKRKIIYMGGFEEISGTHVLYQDKEEKYMELPTHLQVYIVQDNLEVYSNVECEDLQTRNYADVDGPSYRFCAEDSKQHAGYARLRYADKNPGISRNNTYEDIYSFMPPVDENEPDPVVDLRPLKGAMLNTYYEDMTQNPSPIYEEEKNSSNDDIMPQASSHTRRRGSGILPINYPQYHPKNRDQEIKENGIPNGDLHIPRPHVTPRNINERRPSGIFPKMSPNMDRLSFSKKDKNKINTNDEFALLRKALAEIEEESEDEEEGEDVVDSGMNTTTNNTMKDLSAGRYESTEEEEGQDVTDTPKEEPHLSASVNPGCFLNRKIKLKEEGDAYGIRTKAELRTYFSSLRYLECFEEDFQDLLGILKKEHLFDTSNMQMPAILTNELMIEGIGPKFNTEFIPTLALKEWPTCAIEWKFRERKSRSDPETQKIYRWPSPRIVNEVASMGCNLVPIGHYNPSNPNKVMNIEWQFQFLRAEQWLLRSLGQTQIALLIIVEYLMKDHLKDVPGLKPQHLRYILFWMCEHNFSGWEEERLGIKLKAYLKTLYNSLSQEKLPHYFINKCNLLETIPPRYLRQIQATVRNMKDNIPIYLMHTMRRMRTEDDFYPTIDIKKLYELVIPEYFGLERLLNPGLTNLEDCGEDVLYSDSEEEEQVIKDALHRKRREAKLKVLKESGVTIQKKRRASTINLHEKVRCVRDLRAGKLLSMFANHFIGMARSSNEYRSYPQSFMYLLLAGNMATLLEETGNGQEAEDFRKRIDDLNIASRGGVHDMLGSSWIMTDDYDLIPGNRSLRGSNWELKEGQPLPKPPRDASPRPGLQFSKHNFSHGMKSNFENLNNTLNSRRKLSRDDSRDSDTIEDLPDTGARSQDDSAQKLIIASDDEDFGSTYL